MYWALARRRPGCGSAHHAQRDGSIPFHRSHGQHGTIIAAVAGAVTVLLLILAVSARIKDSITILVLGMIFGYVASALVTILQSFTDPDSLKVFVTWTFGSLGGVTWDKMPLLLILVLSGIVIAFFMQKILNSLLLGEIMQRAPD